MEPKKSRLQRVLSAKTTVVLLNKLGYYRPMSTMGRPTLYRPELCEQARNYCLLGATNNELAEFFGVCPSTIDNWIVRHADFEAAVKSGRAFADARVARGLYNRAIG